MIIVHRVSFYPFLVNRQVIAFIGAVSGRCDSERWMRIRTALLSYIRIPEADYDA